MKENTRTKETRRNNGGGGGLKNKMNTFTFENHVRFTDRPIERQS